MFSVELLYPLFDENTQKHGDEDDAEARIEERIDSDSIGRWGEHCSNVWIRCAVQHDARLVEEDVLDSIEWVFFQESVGLEKKCRQYGGEECTLGDGNGQVCWILLGLFGSGVQLEGSHRVPATGVRASCLQCQ